MRRRSTQLARGADLLLAEASFRDGDDNPPELHLTGTDCGEVATAADVGRLVLTHVPPWYDPQDMLAEAQTVVGRPVELARAGRDVRRLAGVRPARRRGRRSRSAPGW